MRFQHKKWMSTIRGTGYEFRQVFCSPRGGYRNFLSGGGGGGRGGTARLIKVILKVGVGPQKGVGAGGGYTPYRASRGSFSYYLNIKA